MNLSITEAFKLAGKPMPTDAAVAAVLYRPSDIVADIEPAQLVVVRAETAVRSLTDTEGQPAEALDALVLAKRARD